MDIAEIEVMKAIRAAILCGDTPRAMTLIGSDRARLEMMTPFGTWLHVAAKAGHLDIVRELVAVGADINRRGGTLGGTPINIAAAYGQVAIVEFLLRGGAKLDLTEPERNPLFSAIHGGHLPTVKLLVERGIDTTVAYTGPSMKGMTAEAFALERGLTEIAQFLRGT